jgi:hypothetical protein
MSLYDSSEDGRRESNCDMRSVPVRRSASGFPGLIKSRRVRAQQSVWTKRRAAMQVWNVEDFAMMA